jgi:outer membrane immunogenic protein
LLAFIGGAETAPAADLAPKPYVNAPVAPTPASDWTGFYAGLNLGYGVGSDPMQWWPYPTFPTTQRFVIAPAGELGGAQIGYNIQAGSWVLGLEGDIQASRLRQTPICFSTCGSMNVFLATQELSWLATVRARLGYSLGPALFYATGGAAFAGVKTSISSVADTFPTVVGNSNQTRAGWTLGGGLEAALGGHWSAKVEYLYADLGRVSYSVADPSDASAPARNFSADIGEHVFRVGLNYLMNDVPRGFYASLANAHAMTPAAISWTGFYLGGNIGVGVGAGLGGYGEGGLAVGQDADQTSFAPRTLNGGIQVGANWQMQNLVFGIEADAQLNDQRRTGCVFCDPNGHTDIDVALPWFATLRGRVGYAMGPVLVYGTGGAAVGRVDSRFVEEFFGTTNASGRFSDTKPGWTAGAGVETVLSGRWTAKAEYLHLDLGQVAHDVPPPVPAGNLRQFWTSIHDHIFRLALNYKFAP